MRRGLVLGAIVAMGMLAARLTKEQRAEARARTKKFVALTGPLPPSENR